MKKGYNLLVLDALNFFIENPYEEIHLREFSRKLKISVNSAQRFLNLFLKENLIRDKRKANLRYFKANINSVVFRSIKITFSLKKLDGVGIINSLKETASNLVLFGSVGQGKDDSNSDVDLVIISKNKERTREIISQIQRKFGREINTHIFNPIEWKNQKQRNKAFYQEVISTGINLIGELPL